MSPVSGSESTKTGLAPTPSIAFAEATNVIAGTTTSDPAPTSRARRPSGSAAVQEDRHLTAEAPTWLAVGR